MWNFREKKLWWHFKLNSQQCWTKKDVKRVCYDAASSKQSINLQIENIRRLIWSNMGLYSWEYHFQQFTIFVSKVLERIDGKQWCYYWHCCPHWQTVCYEKPFSGKETANKRTDGHHWNSANRPLSHGPELVTYHRKGKHGFYSCSPFYYFPRIRKSTLSSCTPLYLTIWLMGSVERGTNWAMVSPIPQFGRCLNKHGFLNRRKGRMACRRSGVHYYHHMFQGDAWTFYPVEQKCWQSDANEKDEWEAKGRMSDDLETKWTDVKGGSCVTLENFPARSIKRTSHEH